VAAVVVAVQLLQNLTMAMEEVTEEAVMEEL
jgi:hypothetical protein